MTKQELVLWIRKNSWNKLPKLSDVLFIRWEIQSHADEALRALESDSLKSIDSELRNKLAKEFNAEKDLDARLILLGKISGIDKQLDDFHQSSIKTGARFNKIQSIYERAESERAKGN